MKNDKTTNTTGPSAAVSAQALHRREYRYGTLPNSGWRFLNEGETIERGDYTYHVSDSTYIPCVMSVGRKVDRADAGAKFIRLETEDNYREEEIADARKRYAEAPSAAVSAHTDHNPLNPLAAPTLGAMRAAEALGKLMRESNRRVITAREVAWLIDKETSLPTLLEATERGLSCVKEIEETDSDATADLEFIEAALKAAKGAK